MSQRTFKHQITVDISETEKAEMDARVADICRQEIQLQLERSEAISEFKKTGNALAKEKGSLLAATASGRAKQEIEVYEEKDIRLNRMVYRRASDGEQVDERPLTADELNEDKQGDLFAGKGTVETTGEEAPPAAADGDEPPNDADLEKTLAAFEAEQDAAAPAESDEDEDEDEDDESDDEDGDADEAGEAAPAQ